MPLFLSQLRGLPVRDRDGRELGRLKDLVLQERTAMPAVAGFTLRLRAGVRYVPIDQGAVWHPDRLDLAVSARELAPVPPPEGRVYLLRDLQDAQVVDLDGARVVRVNDVVLDRLQGQLVVAGLDVGSWGLARRLGLERPLAWLARLLRWSVPAGVIPWSAVEPLAKDASRVQLAVPGDRLVMLHPADLARVLEEVGHAQRLHLVDGMTDVQLAELIEESDADMQAALLHDLSPARAAEVIEAMAPDEAADLLGELAAAEASELMRLMAPAGAAELEQLLQYEANTAGAMMTPSYLAVGEGASVGEAIAWFRRARAEVEVMAYVYLTDPEGRLSGVVSIRHLLLAEPATPLSRLSSPQVYRVHVHTPAREVVHQVAHYQLTALPVVDAGQRLVGVVTVGDVLERVMGAAEG